MSLNIKNERVHELARRAARRTGQSQTAVIEAALTKLLNELGDDPALTERQRRLDLVHDISLAWAPADGVDPAEIDDLYGPATGLPA